MDRSCYKKGYPMSTNRTFQYLKGVTTLRFSRELCISCRRCIEVCPHAVFGIRNGIVILQDRDACMECGACAKNCPTSAIQVRAGVGCAYAVLASKWFRTPGWFKKRSQTDSCCMRADELSKKSPCCGGGGCCGS